MTSFVRKLGLAASAATVAASAGFYLAATSRDGMVVVPSSRFVSPRGPAAIRRVFDFSHLNGSALRLASQKRLVTDARVIASAAQTGVELGHFVTRAADGSRLFACEFFDRVTLTFEAEGVAEGGEKATLRVDGPCAMGQDLNRIAPIWIPHARIVSEKPAADLELAFADVSGVNYKFENVPSDWPRKWVLTEIRVFNSEETGRELAISRREMIEIGGAPIRLTW